MNEVIFGRAARAAARSAADTALVAWFDVHVAALAGIADRVGVTDTDGGRVVVFTATETGTGDGPGWSEQLGTVVVSSLHAEVVLEAADQTHPEEWVEAVDVWVSLRECLSALNGAPAAPGLVVDLDGRVVGCWSATYCPEFGLFPDSVQRVPTVEEQAAAADPFTALLDPDAADRDAGHAYVRLEEVLESHQLDVPSAPSHEPGECDWVEEDQDL